MMIGEKKVKKIFCIIAAISLFGLLVLVEPIVSPMQYSDGIPMLNRVYLFEIGNYNLGYFLFCKHGNSLHTIVYFIAMLDSWFFSNMPVIMRAIEYIGLAATIIIYTKILTKIIWENESISSKVKFTYAFMFFLCILLLIIGCTQLLLPFQIALSGSRPLYLLVLYFLSVLFADKNAVSRHKYALCVLSACLVAPLHGMGLMFAGAFVFLHIIYRSGKKIMISFLPAVVTLIIQFAYNEGMGEITSAKGNYLLDHFWIFGKSMVCFFATPISSLGMSRPAMLIIAFVIWAFVIWKVVTDGMIGLGINKFSVFPEKMRNMNRKYTVEQGFFMGTLGMAFLASVSAALFVTARLEFYPNIAADPVGYVLSSNRYSCFAVAPYICMLNKILKCLLKGKEKRWITAWVVVYVCICINYAHAIDEIKFLNKNLDLAAVSLLSNVDIKSSVPSQMFPGYTEDEYWNTAIPITMEYFKSKDEFLWHNQPDFAQTLGSSVSKMMLENVKTSRYEEDDQYVVFEGKTTHIVSKRYAAILDINGTVVGFAYVTQKPKFVFRDHRIYYDHSYMVKGFALESACKGSPLAVITE